VLSGAVGASARLRAWLDGRDIQLAAQLEEAVSFPEQVMADAARTSLRDAGRVVDRAATVEALPALEAALAAGSVGAGHVDVFTRALRRVERAQRPALLAEGDRLVAVAARSTPDELDRTVKATIRRIEAGDGMDRLEQQRRACRLRTWLDREGMFCLQGRYSPEVGVTLHHRLTATVEALFA
jgi:FAD/FMN-containing dehydrogenase